MTAATQRAHAEAAPPETADPPFARTAFTPDHARFLELQPLIIAVAPDAAGRPWTAPLFGRPGFISVPSSRHVRIDAAFADGDPLAGALGTGTAIGLIAVEFASARTCRMLGRVSAGRDDVLHVSIDRVTATRGGEISPRRWHFTPWLGLGRPGAAGRDMNMFDADAARLLQSADTVFVGGLGEAASETPLGGLFHIGRAAGLIDVIGQRELLCPEIATVLSPPATADAAVGLVVIDYASGDILQAAGRLTPSARHGTTFVLEAGRWSARACPLEWSTPPA